MTAQAQAHDERVHITKLHVKPEEVGKHVDWLARLMMIGVGSAHVLSAEIIPPSADETEWMLVQRFSNEETLDRWTKLEARQRLYDEFNSANKNNGVRFTESVDSTFGTIGSVAVAVVTHVKPGQESAYCDCEGKYQSAQAQYPGYRGAYVQPPTPGMPGLWTTLIRFDSPATMDQWFNSEERKNLVGESDPLVCSTAFQNVQTSYPGWFPTGAAGSKGPPNWKAAMLILLGLYPIVMLEIKFLMPQLHALPAAAANFIGNILSVVLTTWVTMPLAIKASNAWLFPKDDTPKWVAPITILSLICIYAVEIGLLWRLL